jgi:hypothetical protein
LTSGSPEHYDAFSADMFRADVVERPVAFLADLAGPGPALEFGIGTGRIALPLAARGVTVKGIDLICRSSLRRTVTSGRPSST